MKVFNSVLLSQCYFITYQESDKGGPFIPTVLYFILIRSTSPTESSIMSTQLIPDRDILPDQPFKIL